jgi:curved DNA-binding protein CbpA
MSRPGDTLDDYFATLGLPRAAAIDEQVLHRAYTEHSRHAHPDHGGSEAAAALVNAAYESLRQPEKRLKHLLELAGPSEAVAWRTVPLDEDMMQLFSALSAAMDASAKFLDRKTKAASALARALLANEEMQHRDVLEQIGFKIEARKDGMEALLPSLDTAIKDQQPDGWKQLAATQARFAYLAKWQSQVRERLLALM